MNPEPVAETNAQLLSQENRSLAVAALQSPLTHALRPTVAVILLAAGAVQLGCQHLRNEPDSEPEVRIVDAFIDFKLDEPGDAWAFRTPQLWRVAVEGERRFLQMAVPPERDMLPGVRRPQEYALYAPHRFRSFNLTCRARVECDPSVAGRDACIIFGRQDETHFYYVHLSNTASEFHSAIVRVDGDTRTSLIPQNRRPSPTVPGKDWHKFDIIRDVDAGTITVYVDQYEAGREEPWAQVKDATYDWGHIGFGSFNDHASFANIIIQGQAR